MGSTHALCTRWMPPGGQPGTPKPAAASPRAAGEPKGAPSLADISLEALACSIQGQRSLIGPHGELLPEELCCCLFQRVIELGKLNPRVLQLFEETEHEALLEAIQGLGIRRWTPPLLPTSRGGPLGYSRPPWE